MFLSSFESVEAGLFRALNGFLEPLVRAGIGSPVLWPMGPIVVETQGRKSGGQFNVPLLAMVVGDLVVVSTLRRRSNWIRNLAAAPRVRYWLGGARREASAAVIGNGLDTLDQLPGSASCLAGALKQHSRVFGTSFAILMPQPSSAS